MSEKKVIFTKDNNVIGVLHEECETNGTLEYSVGKILIAMADTIGRIRFAPFYCEGKRTGFVSLDDNNNVLDVVPMSILELIDAENVDIKIVDEEVE